MGIAEVALAEDPGRVADPTDQQLVTAVRHGDDRGFESLYSRYHRRIGAYVFGMVKDHGRAEDITQEVFVSALRRMRATERPIAFKPWIFEIAKNACIDAYRRGQRAEEVSFDADHLTPDDYGRLVATGLEPDAAIDAKQDLEHLCGAFGGLSDTYHKILVLREFEGLSYSAIGERLGLSRSAVESTLFRARKRLGEEYDEIASGARCLRVEGIIANAGESRLGLRDRGRLARHISHCQPCRRLAAQSGVDIALPVRTRVAGKIAAWLPIPAFLRLRRGGGEDVTSAAGGSGWVTHGPMIAESMQSGWSKAAAGLAAVLVAGAGVGVTTSVRGDARQGAAQRPAAHHAAPRAPSAGAAVAAPSAATRAASQRATRGHVAAAKSGGSATRSAGAGGRGSAGPGNQPTPAPHGGGGGSNPTAQADPARAAADQAAAKVPQLPTANVPAGAGGPAVQTVNQAAQNMTRTVDHATQDVTQTVDHATQNATQTVDHATQNVTQTASQPGNVVPNTTNTVTDAGHDVGGTVGGALHDGGNTVGGLLKP